jgi:hypothetical protein
VGQFRRVRVGALEAAAERAQRDVNERRARALLDGLLCAALLRVVWLRVATLRRQRGPEREAALRARACVRVLKTQRPAR